MRSGRAAFLALALLACGSPPPASDAGHDGGTDAPDAFDAPEPTETIAALRAPRYADLGATITLDASESVGDEFTFDLGDGRQVGPSADARVEVTYPEPGRYQVVVEVVGPSGPRTAGAVVTVTPPQVHPPAQSSTIVRGERLGGPEILALARDGGRLLIVDPTTDTLRIAVATCPQPATLATSGAADEVVVACPESDEVWFHRRSDGEVVARVPLPRGSRPYGVVGGAGYHVTLQGTAQVATFTAEGVVPERSWPTGPDPRGIALAPDTRLAITRWRSPDDRGVVELLDPDTGAREEVALRFDPQPGNDTESGGVPSYLEQILFAPDGVQAAVPSTQANIGEGTFRSERPLTFETTVRAALSWVESAAGAAWAEDFEARRLFDNRGLAGSGTFNERGDYLFVTMRGARAVERIDALDRTATGTILGTGHGVTGLAMVGDKLYVNAELSRVIEVYDVSDFRTLPRPVASVPTVEEEPLAPEILLGMQLFADSADPRLARDGYVACAHCHLDGDSDHRVWDFTDRGEGLRRTPPLFGRTQEGALHWSANFDEVQDFENDIRLHFGGQGLMARADWEATMDTLGAPKAGRSEALDALAAYVRSLERHLPSPFREPDGSLTPAATRGQAVFEAAGCADCHRGATLSDSGFVDGDPVLHDVGTLGAGSGGRLGGPLPGLDTPTLHGLWHQPRLLHDGSATLREVLTTRNPDDRHGRTSGLSEDELADLEAYLLGLDG